MSKQKKKKPTAFADLHHLSEDERIEMIGETVMSSAAGEVVGFVTDADLGKSDRYVRKILQRFPAIQIIGKKAGPVPGTVVVRATRIAASTAAVEQN